jgi:hypothetical protein
MEPKENEFVHIVIDNLKIHKIQIFISRTGIYGNTSIYLYETVYIVEFVLDAAKVNKGITSEWNTW